MPTPTFFDVINYVRDIEVAPNGEPVTRSERDVLLAIGSHLSMKTLDAYPSVKTIAMGAHFKERHTRTLLRSLERKGVLSTEQTIGADKVPNSSHYRFPDFEKRFGIAEMVEGMGRELGPHMGRESGPHMGRESGPHMGFSGAPLDGARVRAPKRTRELPGELPGEQPGEHGATLPPVALASASAPSGAASPPSALRMDRTNQDVGTRTPATAPRGDSDRQIIGKVNFRTGFGPRRQNEERGLLSPPLDSTSAPGVASASGGQTAGIPNYRTSFVLRPKPENSGQDKLADDEGGDIKGTA